MNYPCAKEQSRVVWVWGATFCRPTQLALVAAPKKMVQNTMLEVVSQIQQVLYGVSARRWGSFEFLLHSRKIKNSNRYGGAWGSGRGPLNANSASVMVEVRWGKILRGHCNDLLILCVPWAGGNIYVYMISRNVFLSMIALFWLQDMVSLC